MDYESLRIFLHLSETLHFGRTSRECFLTPSALSRSLLSLPKSSLPILATIAVLAPVRAAWSIAMAGAPLG